MWSKWTHPDGVGRIVLTLACLATWFSWTASASAQPPNQGSNLPSPRLLTLTPPGGQAGQTVEVGFTGSDLEEPETLLFSVPGIKVEPIIPPPPMPDPKKPDAK